MEKIEPGKYVEMVYDLSVVTPDGEELVHKVEPDSPERIVFGVTMGVIVPLKRQSKVLRKVMHLMLRLARPKASALTTPSRWLISTSRFSKSRENLMMNT